MINGKRERERDMLLYKSTLCALGILLLYNNDMYKHKLLLLEEMTGWPAYSRIPT